MRIVVIGGKGRIGSKLIDNLTEHGHDAVAADLRIGVNTLTGDGLLEALADAEVVVDVSDSPSFEDAAVMDFFQTSTGNILAAERAAGVGHHVALSVVGADRLPDSGYLRAKVAQEKLIQDSSVPYSIVRATQFYEFVTSIADAATDGDTVRLPTALIQPIAADEVARAVARIAVGAPVNGIVEVGGPEPYRFDELIREREQRPASRRRGPRRALLRHQAERDQSAARQGRPARRDPVRGPAERASPNTAGMIGSRNAAQCPNPREKNAIYSHRARPIRP
jgi:uncharacterized protein YbjT (DUF2867 family)